MSLEQDKSFERQLRQIKPKQPDEMLVERIGAAIDKADAGDRKGKWGSYFAWSGLVAAASIMIVVGLSLFNRGTEIQSSSVSETVENLEPLIVPEAAVGDESFKPVLAQNNLQERVDEGIVFLRNGLTARKYRYEFIDRVVWKNPVNGAVVEMEVPRDEVVLIPVQTF